MALGIGEKSQLSLENYQIEYEYVNKVLTQLESIKRDKILYNIYDMKNQHHKDFLTTKILIGSSIEAFLGNPTKIIICATTLGSQVDELIRRESMMSISSAVLFDTAAMVVIEEHLDEWIKSIETLDEISSSFLSARFSPGYGDMPLTMQGDILQALEAQKMIVLTVSDSNILLPKKSVTAVIGIYDAPFESNYSNCDSCLIRPVCKKRERGDYCGY